MNKSVASSLLVMHALGNVAAFMSNPDYYSWAFFSAPSLLATCFLVNQQTAKLVALSYLAIGTYSFIIGRVFFHEGRLSDAGVVAMLPVFPIIIYAVFRAYSSRPRPQAV